MIRRALSVDQMKVTERFFDSVLIHTVGHVVRGGLDFIVCIAHCDSDAGKLQHLDVVFAVAEGHDL